MRTKKVEGLILQNAKVGEIFYTDKKPNQMTGLANYYERKISTCAVGIINKKTFESGTLLRVTIVQ